MPRAKKAKEVKPHRGFPVYWPRGSKTPFSHTIKAKLAANQPLADHFTSLVLGHRKPVPKDAKTQEEQDRFTHGDRFAAWGLLHARDLIAESKVEVDSAATAAELFNTAGRAPRTGLGKETLAHIDAFLAKHASKRKKARGGSAAEALASSSSSSSSSSATSSEEGEVLTGPRGGRYRLTASGKKRYIAAGSVGLDAEPIDCNDGASESDEETEEQKDKAFEAWIELAREKRLLLSWAALKTLKKKGKPVKLATSLEQGHGNIEVLSFGTGPNGENELGGEPYEDNEGDGLAPFFEDDGLAVLGSGSDSSMLVSKLSKMPPPPFDSNTDIVVFSKSLEK